MIVCLDVVRDGIDQLLHAMEDATTNSFLSDFPKPALDQIEPGRAGRDEMDVKAGMLRESSFYLRVLVCRVVVDDQMQVQVWWGLFVDLPQELEPLLMAMTLHARTDHFTLKEFQCGKKSGGAIAFVVMSHGATASLFEGQTWLGSVEGLDLGFLINAQDESMIGRVHVEAHHILNLLYKMLVIAQLEGPRQMGLQPMGFPDPVDQRMVNSKLFSETPRAPMGGTSRFFLSGLVNDDLNQIPALLWSSAATWGVPDNALYPLLGITPPPQPDCSLVHRKPLSDLLVVKPS